MAVREPVQESFEFTNATKCEVAEREVTKLEALSTQLSEMRNDVTKLEAALELLTTEVIRYTESNL